MTNPRLVNGLTQPIQLPDMFRRYSNRLHDELILRLSQDQGNVYDMLRYYMGWADVEGRPCVATQGKLLRPTLCLFACEATSGRFENALPAAVALEFIHNFSLIHDDIQDRDETRHHRATLWTVWGEPKALVAGNVLRIIADTTMGILIENGLPSNLALAAHSLLTEAYLEMIEGQFLDLSFEGRPDIGMDDYLGMISRKTGALIRCSVNLGIAIGAQDPEAINAFRVFGKSIGYAFQIRDDYLGVWGQESSTGKPVGADIRRKKNSFPVVHAIAHATGESRSALLEIYRKDDLTDGDVALVLEVMDEVNTREHAQKLTESHCDRAMSSLDSVELSPSVRQEIAELMHFLAVREH